MLPLLLLLATSSPGYAEGGGAVDIVEVRGNGRLMRRQTKAPQQQRQGSPLAPAAELATHIQLHREPPRELLLHEDRDTGMRGLFLNGRGHCLGSIRMGSQSTGSEDIVMQPCDHQSLRQLWIYRSFSGHIESRGHCLGILGEDAVNSTVLLGLCKENEDGASATTRWSYGLRGELRSPQGHCLESSNSCGKIGTLHLQRCAARGSSGDIGQTWRLLSRGSDERPLLGEEEEAEWPRKSVSSWSSSLLSGAETKLDPPAVLHEEEDHEDLAYVQACADEVDPGIRFVGGKDARCEELVNYCEHPQLGQRIQEACVKTCGRCGLTGLNPSSADLSACEDKTMDEGPTFILHGETMDCGNLLAYCVGHHASDAVLRKCPRSCGFCAPTPDRSIMSCDRRRRWGFCIYTRRRDVWLR